MMFSINLSQIHPGVKRISKLMLPMMIGLSVTQINLIVNTILASYLPEGSVTYLYYGMRMIHFPLALFGVSLAMAILPTMSIQAVKKEFGELRKTLSFGLRLVFFVTFPALLGLILLRIPIVNLLFQYGRFDYTATLGTATTIFYYSLGLWAFAGVRIVIPTFYALQDTRTPMMIGAVAMIANIILSLILMKPLQHGGLALSTSIASMINFTLLTLILRKRLGRIEGKRILASLIKFFIASIWIIIISYMVSNYDIWSGSGDKIYKSIILIAGMGISLSGYLVISYLLKSEEMHFLFEMVKGKFNRISKERC